MSSRDKSQSAAKPTNKFVDHEMIAAGHPDLYFELDSFSAVMRALESAARISAREAR